MQDDLLKYNINFSVLPLILKSARLSSENLENNIIIVSKKKSFMLTIIFGNVTKYAVKKEKKFGKVRRLTGNQNFSTSVFLKIYYFFFYYTASKFILFLITYFILHYLFSVYFLVIV